MPGTCHPIILCERNSDMEWCHITSSKFINFDTGYDQQWLVETIGAFLMIMTNKVNNLQQYFHKINQCEYFKQNSTVDDHEHIVDQRRKVEKLIIFIIFHKFVVHTSLS